MALLKRMRDTTTHIGPFLDGVVEWVWLHGEHKETRTNVLQPKAQPRPANRGAVALFVFVCNSVKSEPPDARFMANQHLWEGEEPTQAAQETFDSRLVR